MPVLDFPILEESSVHLDSISSGTNDSFRLQSPGWAADWSGMTSKQNQLPTWCDLLGPVLVSLVPVAQSVTIKLLSRSCLWVILFCFSSMCVLSLFSGVRLFATLWTTVHQVPLSMGILQARILEWVAMPSFKGSSRPRDQTQVSYASCIGRRVLYL